MAGGAARAAAMAVGLQSPEDLGQVSVLYLQIRGEISAIAWVFISNASKSVRHGPHAERREQ